MTIFEGKRSDLWQTPQPLWDMPFGSILIGYNVPPPSGVEGTLIRLDR